MKKYIILITVMLLLTSCSSVKEAIMAGTMEGPVIEINRREEIEEDKLRSYTYINEKVAFPADLNTGLNPIETKSRYNMQWMPLVYLPLVKLDNKFSPQFCIASEYKAENEYEVWSFTIDTSIQRHDGVNVTANDVAESVKKIKNTADGYYFSRMKNVAKIEVSDDKVIFTLTEPNRFFPQLCDFPILSYDGNAVKENVGTGPYKLAEKDGKIFLLRKELKALPADDVKRSSGAKNIETIELIDIKNRDDMLNMLSQSELDALISVSSEDTAPFHMGNFMPYTGLSNRLIFIGVNFNNKLLSNQSIRQAISLALDRYGMTNSVFNGQASAVSLPLNPAWEHYIKGNSRINSDTKAVDGIMQSFNYIKDEYGIYRTNDSKREQISLNLVVNYENTKRTKLAEEVKRQLYISGIEAVITEYNYNDYINALKAGNFDLYLGEITLPGDMNVSNLIEQKSEQNYGKCTAVGYINALKDFNRGIVSVGETSGYAWDEINSAAPSMKEQLSILNDIFLEELPIIPLMTASSVLYVPKNITVDSGNKTYFYGYGSVEQWLITT